MKDFNRNIKNILGKRTLAVSAVMGITFGILSQNLPVKEILGQEYYVYEVKKGDSVYGIAHKFGWDETELIRLNPTISDGLKKGEILYYPTGKVTQVEIEPQEETGPIVPEDLPPLVHIVKRGETVYSIAKMYDIPISVIYESHPSARKGIKAGETLTINQNGTGFGDPAIIPFFYLTVKPGDTLYSTAKKYGLSVETLLKANPGVSETNFKAGSLLKIPTQNTTPKVKRTMVEVQSVGTLTPYKVGKDDTWSSISRKTGVDINDLKEANSDVSKLKKNEILAIPSLETDTIERIVAYSDPREESVHGRQQIYDSIHHIDVTQTIKDVRIGVILEDPNSKRDIEFSRGFLLALKQLGEPGYQVGVKMMAANIPADDLKKELEGYSPQVIFSLSDKGIADWLLDFSAGTGAEAINVFDAKSDQYSSAPPVIQLLTPSGYFNESIAKGLASNYRNRVLVTVTKGQSADMLAETIASDFPGGETSRITMENLTTSSLPDSSDVLLVADITEKEDVVQLIEKIKEIKDENPMRSITVVGRPNWVTFADALAEQFYETDVIIPSRFYFNPESESGKTFISDFTDTYGRGPLKSYPNYAATGYDAANWFIPALALNEGDFNITVPKTDLLQMPLELTRISNWGGFYNTSGLMIHFTPWRTQEVEVVN